MHRKLTSELLPFDPKLEKTLRKLKSQKWNKSKWRIFKMIDTVKATSTRMIFLELENRLWETIGNLCLMIIIHEFDNILSMQTILSWNLVLFRWYNNNSLEAIL